MINKGYSSVSTVENDDSDDPERHSGKKQSMSDMLKASAHRRNQQNRQNRNSGRANNNLPAMVQDESSDSDTGDSRDAINASRAPPPRYQSTSGGNNIGNIPGAGGSMTNCMNSSLRLCKLFGIEIHIHILMPLFFVGSFVDSSIVNNPF